MINNNYMSSKGGVETIFTILFIIIASISAFFVIRSGIFPSQVKSYCISEQFKMLGYLDEPNGTGLVQRLKLRKGNEPNVSFIVGRCIDCIWYDPTNSQLKIKVEDEKDPRIWNVSVPYMEVGYDCGKCNDCANLKKDTTYIFWVNSTLVNCTGVINEDGSIGPCPKSSNPYR